jgi:hypothetical protein
LFKGLGNLANLGGILKQAQEMGGRMKQLNEELRKQTAKGSAGGGLIEVEVNGLAEVLAVRIDPSLVERGDREMIEDLLPGAFNAASQKAKELHAEAVRSMTAGLNLPGLEQALGNVMGSDDAGGDKVE